MSKQKLGEKRLSELKVLVIDDFRDSSTSVTKLLKSEGADVYEVKDGRIIVKKAFEHSVDVIVIDIPLPEMNGAYLMELLTMAGFRKPVIAVGHEPKVKERARDLQGLFSEFIVRPFSAVTLSDSLLIHTKKFKRKTVGNVIYL